MIEKQSIKNRDVWVRVDAYHPERPNAKVIPTEYFTAAYFLNEPVNEHDQGEIINEDDGNIRLFESPVAALSFVRKKLESVL